MNQILINPKSIGGFVRTISGLFITKANPQGITQAELKILTALYVTLVKQNKQVIDKEVKIALADLTNNKLQVIVNYINKLKKKNVVTGDDRLHSVFYKKQIIIEYGESTL